MSETASVSVWLEQLQGGDQDAARRIWQRYFSRLVGLARKKLRGLPRRGADEEDVALSAFDSFCRAAEGGRFPDLDDRDDLWQILFMITERKAIDLIEYESRARRDYRRRQNAPPSESVGAGLGAIAGREPDPAFAAEVAETCDSLLGRLKEENMRTVAMRKLEGYTNEEIATELDCSLSTIERLLRVIRREWCE